MAIGLFLAVIVNQKIRGQTFFRASFYFPAIASSAAITVLFIFIVRPDGLFNGIREALGINPLFALSASARNHNWFGDSRTALNSRDPPQRLDDLRHDHAVLPGLLQSISGEVYEAAAIDGAGAWQTFRRITFPLLRRATSSWPPCR